MKAWGPRMQNGLSKRALNVRLNPMILYNCPSPSWMSDVLQGPFMHMSSSPVVFVAVSSVARTVHR